MHAVIYAWRPRPGCEERFREGWRRVTAALRDEYGSFGSRLHRTADGRLVAYALWPSEDLWRRALEAEALDPEGSAMMRDSAEPDGDNGAVVALGAVLDDLLVAP